MELAGPASGAAAGVVVGSFLATSPCLVVSIVAAALGFSGAAADAILSAAAKVASIPGCCVLHYCRAHLNCQV